MGCVFILRNHNQPPFSNQYLPSIERRRRYREMVWIELGGRVGFVAVLGF
jgi:hypothetical protein